MASVTGRGVAQHRDDAQHARHRRQATPPTTTEHIVAGDVRDRVEHGVLVERTLRQQQCELLDFLACGEQVAFAALGQERERLAAPALAVAGQPRGDPHGKGGAVDRRHCDRHAGAGERAEPRR